MTEREARLRAIMTDASRLTNSDYLGEAAFKQRIEKLAYAIFDLATVVLEDGKV